MAIFVQNLTTSAHEPKLYTKQLTFEGTSNQKMTSTWIINKQDLPQSFNCMYMQSQNILSFCLFDFNNSDDQINISAVRYLDDGTSKLWGPRNSFVFQYNNNPSLSHVAGSIQYNTTTKDITINLTCLDNSVNRKNGVYTTTKEVSFYIY